MKPFKIFKKDSDKEKSTIKDKADAILVTAIISMPLIMIAFGFAADTAKNVYVSNTYATKAQAAIETAVKSIDSRGSLNNDSVRKFISEFDTQAKGSEVQTNESKSFETKSCSTAKINNVERKLPYYEIELGTARAKDTEGTSNLWKVQAGSQVVDQQLYRTDSKGKRVKYKVIRADVYNGSQNIILGMFGQPCQLVKSSVSAISFGDNTDLL